MGSGDFLNYSIGLGFLILVGFASYAFYNLSLTLKQSTSILTKVDDITKDVESLKDVIKNGILYLLNIFKKKATGPIGPMARGEVKGNDNKK